MLQRHRICYFLDVAQNKNRAKCFGMIDDDERWLRGGSSSCSNNRTIFDFSTAASQPSAKISAAACVSVSNTSLSTPRQQHSINNVFNSWPAAAATAARSHAQPYCYVLAPPAAHTPVRALWPARGRQDAIRHITLTHNNNCFVVCRVTLMKHWVPGQDGNPEATLNHAAFCDEMNVSGCGCPGRLIAGEHCPIVLHAWFCGC